MGAKDTKSKPRKVSRRVGDEERHKTAELLSEHHAHGRLTQEEFDDRIGAALTAQTTAELGRLLSDLPIRPPDEAEDDQPPPATEKRRMVVEVDLRIFRKPIVLAVSTGTVVVVGLGISSGTYPEQSVATGLIGMAVGMVTVPLMRRRKRKDD